jgi:hypothetical protein
MSPAVMSLLKEMISSVVLFPVVEMLSDPDFVNRMIVLALKNQTTDESDKPEDDFVDAVDSDDDAFLKSTEPVMLIRGKGQFSMFVSCSHIFSYRGKATSRSSWG